ncbi:MAG: Fpg/Nei family DNA glycosylase [Chthoniobacterales bacterium]|nr:Fpg/Nei family DNA glycosylase [Chthoniobacterales bacterium]
MPELAEVKWYSGQWAPGLGHRVIGVFCREQSRIYRTADPASVRRGLKGCRLGGIQTKGKQMLFVFERCSLGLHLGMTGQLLVETPDHNPGRHDHLVIRQKERSLVFRDPRMFGSLKFSRSVEPVWWRSLPPEILSPAFTLSLLRGRLQRSKLSALKAALLRQDLFPGVGNWMADEIVWRCRIRPDTKIGNLKDNDFNILWRETIEVCRAALKTIGTHGKQPPRAWLFHSRWADGGRCPRDGTLLLRAQVGGRTTAWCPRCQPIR